jgi:cell division initiation protein
MSDLTPLDVLSTEFARGLRGYDVNEVRSFLQQVASGLEALLRERGELRQRIHRLEQENATFREREQALQEALVAAQKTADATVESARREGQRIVEEGQNLADRLVAEAHERAQNVEKIISDLRVRRRETRGDLMRLAELIQGLIRDDQQSEKDDQHTSSIAVLHRKLRETAGQ